MTDQEVVELLKDARIPRIYRTAETTLTSLGEEGLEVKTWLEGEGFQTLRKGGVLVEVITRRARGTRLFYLLARACVLRRMSVHAWHMEEMLNMRGEIIDQINEDNVRVVAFEGMVTQFPQQFDYATRSTMVWTVANWLDAGRSVLLLNDRSIQDAQEYRERERDQMAELTTKRFFIK